MTQIEKIKAEIERLYKLYRLSTSTEAKYRYEAYKELLDFIDSLQAEPVSEDLEQEIHNKAMTAPTYDELRKIALHFVQKEKERLAHYDALTPEQAQLESDFVVNHIKKHNRTPTFIDAIEYGMKLLQKEQMQEVKKNITTTN